MRLRCVQKEGKDDTCKIAVDMVFVDNNRNAPGRKQMDNRGYTKKVLKLNIEKVKTGKMPGGGRVPFPGKPQ